MDETEGFCVLNAGYVAELYERYQQDPAAVDPASRMIFDRMIRPEPQSTGIPAPRVAGSACNRIVRAVNYIESIRKFGYMDARIDPLGGPPPGDPSLAPETHGITEEDLRNLPADIVVGSIAEGKANALEVVRALRRGLLCQPSAMIMRICAGPEEREWLRQAAESGWFRPPADPIDPHALLERLSEVEAFSRFLLRTFPGKSLFLRRRTRYADSDPG